MSSKQGQKFIKAIYLQVLYLKEIYWPSTSTDHSQLLGILYLADKPFKLTHSILFNKCSWITIKSKVDKFHEQTRDNFFLWNL